MTNSLKMTDRWCYQVNWCELVTLIACLLLAGCSHLRVCKSQIPLRYLIRISCEPASVMEFGFKPLVSYYSMTRQMRMK